MSHPALAARIDAGTYHLRVTIGGFDYDVPAMVFDEHYWIPSTSSSLSIFKVLLDALNDVSVGGGNRFSITFSRSFATGVTARIRENTPTAWDIDYANTSTSDDGKVPLVWFGLTNGDHSSTNGGTFQYIDSLQHPQRTWFPKVHIDDRGRTEREYQSFTTVTVNGSTAHVNHEDTDIEATRNQWATFRFDGAHGALGGRINKTRLSDGYIDWATPTGVSASDPYAALDSPGGFWRATVRGHPFVIMTDELVPASQIGPYRMVRNAEDAPMDVEGWWTLGEPNVIDTGAGSGRRDVQFACLEVA